MAHGALSHKLSAFTPHSCAVARRRKTLGAGTPEPLKITVTLEPFQGQGCGAGAVWRCGKVGSRAYKPWSFASITCVIKQIDTCVLQGSVKVSLCW